MIESKRANIKSVINYAKQNLPHSPPLETFFFFLLSAVRFSRVLSFYIFYIYVAFLSVVAKSIFSVRHGKWFVYITRAQQESNLLM
jgi:hypothetical protein